MEMKLTPQQHRNIANGIERIKEACLRATTPIKSISTPSLLGSALSDRFVRYNVYPTPYHKECFIYQMQKDKNYQYLKPF